MRYSIFDMQAGSLTPAAAALAIGAEWSTSYWNPLAETVVGRSQRAVFESAHRLIKNYPKLGWDYEDVVTKDGRFPVQVTEVRRKAFANLLRFHHDGLPKNAPKVLFIPAMSGHYATLSKGTFEEFIPGHDVYVLDWKNARDVPLSDGNFGFDDYVSYVIEAFRVIGEGVHLVSLCQATVPALVAVCVMCEGEDACRPRSHTMMAGPIDIRVNANQVLELSKRIRLDLLEPLVIQTVPARYAGSGRRIYSGLQQLTAFMSMNPGLHLKKHAGFFMDLVRGDVEEADKHREFYDEYFSVMDVTRDYYIETLERVFLDQKLPKGTLEYEGANVSCESIRDVPTFTIEGADDDMVNVGQTSIALDLSVNLPDNLKASYVPEGVGHYGVFNGQKYQEDISPKIQAFMDKHSGTRH